MVFLSTEMSVASDSHNTNIGMKPKKPIETSILTIRGQKVILDTDLAELYGVAAKVLNQAAKRNEKRFPEDFRFQLTSQESTAVLRSRSQIVTASRRNIRHRPWAFTEHGALQAANVLRSERAVEMSVFVIRAFVLAREQLAANVAILKRLAEIDQTLLEHDSALRTLWTKLQPLLAPPPESPPKRIKGFSKHDD
jgi:hypothetical protein